MGSLEPLTLRRDSGSLTRVSGVAEGASASLDHEPGAFRVIRHHRPGLTNHLLRLPRRRCWTQILPRHLAPPPRPLPRSMFQQMTMMQQAPWAGYAQPGVPVPPSGLSAAALAISTSLSCCSLGSTSRRKYSGSKAPQGYSRETSFSARSLDCELPASWINPQVHPHTGPSAAGPTTMSTGRQGIGVRSHRDPSVRP